MSFRPTSDACIPLVGDWSGSGATTVGLYDPTTSTFYERDSNTSGAADAAFVFGPAGRGWLPVAGDWTGSGVDHRGALRSRRPRCFTCAMPTPRCTPDAAFQFGTAGDGSIPIAGDWTAGGVDNIGLYNPQTSSFALRNSHTPGGADEAFQFGPAGGGWIPLTGDWAGVGEVQAASATPFAAVSDRGLPSVAGGDAVATPVAAEADPAVAADRATPVPAAASPAASFAGVGAETTTAETMAVPGPAVDADAAAPAKVSLRSDLDAAVFDAERNWIEIDGADVASARDTTRGTATAWLRVPATGMAALARPRWVKLLTTRSARRLPAIERSPPVGKPPSPCGRGRVHLFRIARWPPEKAPTSNSAAKISSTTYPP